MSQEQKAAVEAILREVPLDATGDLEVQRPLFEEFMRQVPLPDDITLTEGTLNGVSILEVAPPEADDEARILFFHGGVFALGSARASAALAALLGRQARATVVSVDYRLAPEEPYPAAPDDALAAYRGLLDSGVAPAGVAFFGESAGGALALGTLVAARDAGLPQPAAAVLYSPWVDLTMSGGSMQSKAGLDLALARGGLQLRVADYAGAADAASGAMSPLFADLRGIAPLLIQVGSYEVLLDDATRLAAAAAAADVDVQLDVTSGVQHVFQAYSGLLDESDAAVARTAAFLHAHLVVSDRQTT
jgi:acetyl esterase/lipase